MSIYQVQEVFFSIINFCNAYYTTAIKYSPKCKNYVSYKKSINAIISLNSVFTVISELYIRMHDTNLQLKISLCDNNSIFPPHTDYR